MAEEKSPQPEGKIRPDPDPTRLTTEQLIREQGALKDLLVTMMTGQHAVQNQRMDGMDIAIVLLRQLIDKFPEDREKAIAQLKALNDKEFESIKTQFAERDVRTVQTAQSVQTAVIQALQAQKEASGEQAKSFASASLKTEITFTKQIDGLQALFTKQIDGLQSLIATNAITLDGKINSSTVTLDGKISDAKDRLTMLEGARTGANAEKSSQQSNSTYTVNLISVILGTVIAAAGLIVAMMIKGS